MSTDYANYLEAVIGLAGRAASAILEIYQGEDFAVEHKADDSPLTAADRAAHQVIVAGLRELTPQWPVLSEESAQISYAERRTWERYWLVDPLDGTREFVKRNGEFTVNIALIENRRPVLGVVQVPVGGTVYYAVRGNGAFKREPDMSVSRLQARPCPERGLKIAGSRSHAGESLQAFLACLGDETEVLSIGSALKICLVAEGLADIYPRLGPTSEWDTAAAQCVAEEAGARLTDLNLNPLEYNTKESLLNPHFLVFGEAREHWLACLRRAIGN